MNFVGDRGRLPADDELPNTQVLCEVFGSIRRAFRVVLQVIEKERWDQVAQERAKDLLIYLALARFDHRPAFGKLPRALGLHWMRGLWGLPRISPTAGG